MSLAEPLPLRLLLLCLLLPHLLHVGAQVGVRRGGTRSVLYPRQQSPLFQASSGFPSYGQGGYNRNGPSSSAAGTRAQTWPHKATAFHRLVGQDLVLVCPKWVHHASAIWKKNGVPVGAEPSVARVTLVIRRATLRDSGLYTCGEGAEMGMVYIFIHPRAQAPVVQVTPKSVNVSEGMSVDLRCTADGVPQPVVVWNLMDGLFSSRVMVDGKSLQIRNARASDSGIYSCIATNMEGRYREATSIVTVRERKKGGETIRTDPGLITVVPKYLRRPVGSTFTLRCNVITRVDSSVQWNRNHGRLPPTTMYSKGHRELTITNAQVSDSGVYSCIAQHESGEYYVQASSEVSIFQGGEQLMRDSGLITPEIFKGPVGSTIFLSCKDITGVNSSVHWNRDSGEITSRATYTEGNRGLVITDAQVSDSGIYFCIAQQESGQYYIQSSYKISFIQGGKDIRTDPNLISVVPKEFKGTVGSRVTLSCHAIIGVDSSVQWNRNIGEIPSRVTYTKGNRDLIINNAQVNDSGTYSCITEHESGEYYVQASSDVTIVQGVLETVEIPGLISKIPETNSLLGPHSNSSVI